MTEIHWNFLKRSYSNMKIVCGTLI